MCVYTYVHVCVCGGRGSGGERQMQELVHACMWHIGVCVWSTWLLRVHLYLCVRSVSG